MKQSFPEWLDSWEAQERAGQRRTAIKKKQEWTAEDDCILLLQWLSSSARREAEVKLSMISTPEEDCDREGSPQRRATEEERDAFYVAKYRVLLRVLQDPVTQTVMQRQQLMAMRRADITTEGVLSFQQRYSMLAVVGDDDDKPVMPWASLNVAFITAAWGSTVMKGEITAFKREMAQCMSASTDQLRPLAKRMQVHELAKINDGIWNHEASDSARLERENEKLRKQLEKLQAAGGRKGDGGGGGKVPNGGQAAGGGGGGGTQPSGKSAGMCHDFQNGTCRRGTSCRFQHGAVTDGSAAGGSGSGGGGGQPVPGGNAKWDCGCGANNYAERTVCYKCKAAKPAGGAGAQQANAAAHLQRVSSVASSQIICQLCNKAGHSARDCRNGHQQAQGPRQGNYAEGEQQWQQPQQGGQQQYYLPAEPFLGQGQPTAVYTVAAPRSEASSSVQHSAQGNTARMTAPQQGPPRPDPRALYNPWDSGMWSGGYAAMTAAHPSHEYSASAGQLRASTEAQRQQQQSRRTDDRDVQFQGPRSYVPGTEAMRLNSTMLARCVSILQALNLTVNVLQMIEEGTLPDWEAFRDIVVCMATGKAAEVAAGPLKRGLQHGFDSNKVCASMPQLYTVLWVAVIDQAISQVYGRVGNLKRAGADAEAEVPADSAEAGSGVAAAGVRTVADIECELESAAATAPRRSSRTRAHAAALQTDTDSEVEVAMRKHHFRAAVEAADQSTAAGAILAALPDDGHTFVEAPCFREVLQEGAPETFTVNGMPVFELVHDSGCDHYRINDSKLPADQQAQLQWVAAKPGATSLADGTLSTGDQQLRGGAIISTVRDGRIFRYYAETVYRSHGAAPAHLMGTGIMRALNLQPRWQQRELSIQPRGWAVPAVTSMAPPAGVPPGIVRSFWCVGEELTPTATAGEDGGSSQAHAATVAVEPPMVLDLPSLLQLPQLYKQGLVQLSDRQEGLSVYEPCGGAVTGLEALLANGQRVARYRYSDSNRKARRAAEARV
jgi:hypothetical protein